METEAESGKRRRRQQVWKRVAVGLGIVSGLLSVGLWYASKLVDNVKQEMNRIERND